MNQMFGVRQMCEKILTKGKEICYAFMDLDKAYDLMDRDGLWNDL